MTPQSNKSVNINAPNRKYRLGTSNVCTHLGASASSWRYPILSVQKEIQHYKALCTFFKMLLHLRLPIGNSIGDNLWKHCVRQLTLSDRLNNTGLILEMEGRCKDDLISLVTKAKQTLIQADSLISGASLFTHEIFHLIPIAFWIPHHVLGCISEK